MVTGAGAFPRRASLLPPSTGGGAWTRPELVFRGRPGLRRRRWLAAARGPVGKEVIICSSVGKSHASEGISSRRGISSRISEKGGPYSPAAVAKANCGLRFRCPFVALSGHGGCSPPRVRTGLAIPTRGGEQGG